jgi:hypothetical protein
MNKSVNTTSIRYGSVEGIDVKTWRRRPELEVMYHHDVWSFEDSWAHESLIYFVDFTNQDLHSMPTEHPSPTTLMILPSVAGIHSPCLSQTRIREQLLQETYNPGTAQLISGLRDQ